MIINKKRAFLGNKLIDSIGKPKDLWKALGSPGLPSKTWVAPRSIQSFILPRLIR